MIRPKLRLLFNTFIGILAITFIGLVLFTDFTNSNRSMGFLFIVMILHILKAIFAPKRERNDKDV